MKQSLFAVILGLALLGAACQKQAPAAITTTVSNVNVSNASNSTATNTPTVSAMDSCTLITKGEAEAVFGKPVQEPVLKGAVCRFDTADKTKFFDLTAKSGTDADFETMKNLCDSTAQPVAGLGTTSCSANNTVVVLKNNILMTLIAGGVFNQDQLKDLAVTASGRIL